MFKIALLASLCLFSQMIYAGPEPLKADKKETTHIVVSIEPYALLLRSFIHENERVSVLLEKGFGAHSFHLRPSHLKQLSEADVFIWGGPQLEPYLIDTASKTKRQLILGELQGLDFVSGHHHTHDHSTWNVDPHIWLGQLNSFVLAKAMAQTLTYPETAIEKLGSALLKPLEKAEQNKSLFVFHDAYAYMEKDLKLEKTFVLNDAHEKKAGLKQWQIFQGLVKEHSQDQKGICFVGPPGFEKTTEIKKIKSLLEKAPIQPNVTWLSIDPLAQDKQYTDFAAFLHEKQKALMQCVL